MRIRNLIQIVETASSRVPAVLYHATTTSRWGAIRQHGLVPQHSHDNADRVGIYLADDRLTAEVYWDVSIDRRGGEPVLLQIDGTRLDPSMFEPDDYEVQNYIDDWHDPERDGEDGFRTGMPVDARLSPYRRWQDVPWTLSLAVTHQVFYTGNIHPDLIRRIV